MGNGEDRQFAVNVTVGILLALTSIFVGLRVYARFCILERPHISDYCIILTEVLFAITCGLIFVGVRDGIGRHIQVVSLYDYSTAPEYEFVIELLYVGTTCALRIGIALQLWSVVAQGTSSSRLLQRRAILCLLLLVTGYSAAFFFVLLFQCQPVPFFWTQFRGVTDGWCMDPAFLAGLSYTHAGVSAVSDLSLGLMPIWILWASQMPLRTKVTVAVLLGMGILAGIVAVARIPYITRLIYTQDFFWDSVPIIVCSVLEPAIGILAASASTLRPLYASLNSHLGVPLSLPGSTTRDSLADSAARASKPAFRMRSLPRPHSVSSVDPRGQIAAPSHGGEPGVDAKQPLVTGTRRPGGASDPETGPGDGGGKGVGAGIAAGGQPSVGAAATATCGRDRGMAAQNPSGFHAAAAEEQPAAADAAADGIRMKVEWRVESAPDTDGFLERYREAGRAAPGLREMAVDSNW